MGEGDMAILGQDVVLREKDALTDLLRLLPRKAQLGFSGLREKWSSRSDKSLMKIISAAKTNDSLKVEYTCIDVNSESITIGCNLGIVFMYNRDANTLSRFICENKQVPIVSIKLLKQPNFIATGQFSGAVTIFQYDKEKSGLMKVLLKCTVESHHEAPVTSIQWTYDGTKLFTADSGGNVAITVINMDEGKTHTVFICREDSPVTQLSFCHTALLISTLQRTLIWPFNTKKVVQVGKQSRKVFGNFGACFFPPPGPLPTDEIVDIYAARPGLRLWKATMDGKVLTTMIFKDSVNKGEPIIETLELPPRTRLPHQSEQKQFGTLIPFDNQFLVSWQGSSVWVMDPGTGYIIGCHSNLGYVTDVAVCDNELYVLSKGDQHFIRKIVFETKIPCIVVEELDLNGPIAEEDEEEERRSVFQFNEDQDKLDKLIDEVGSKMIGAICDVKTRVMEFKPFLAGEGYSTSEGLSDVDILRHDDVTSDENNADQLNKPFESSNELPMACEKSPELTQKMKETPFDHLSHEAFPTNIVFEGTSVGRSPKRRKKNKVIKKGILGTELIEEESNNVANERFNDDSGSDLHLLNNIDFNSHTDEDNVNRFTNVSSPSVDKEIFDYEFTENYRVNEADIQNEANCEIQMESVNGDVGYGHLFINDDPHSRNLIEPPICEKNNDMKNIYSDEIRPREERDTLKEFPISDIPDHNQVVHISQTDIYLYSNNTNHIGLVDKDDNTEKDNTKNTIIANNISSENSTVHEIISDLQIITDNNNVPRVNSLTRTNLLRENTNTDSEPEFYFTMDENSHISDYSHLVLTGKQLELDNHKLLNKNEINSIRAEVSGYDSSPNPPTSYENIPVPDAVAVSRNNTYKEVQENSPNDLDIVACQCPSVDIACSNISSTEYIEATSSYSSDKPAENDLTRTENSPAAQEQQSCITQNDKLNDSEICVDISDDFMINSLSKNTTDTPKSLDNLLEKENNISEEQNTQTIKTVDTFAGSNPNPSHRTQCSNTVIHSSNEEIRGLLQQSTSPSHVVNVKISHQRQGSNVSVASVGERCKEIRGEAIETQMPNPPAASVILDDDDTLEANIQQREEEHLSIDCNLDDSVEEGGKLYPMSPFPAPQVQIYSQHSVNLSDFSLNHFLEDVEECGQNDDLIFGLTSDYDRIDVHNDLIESLDSITDVEDNLSHSPPECISRNELKYSYKGPGVVKKRRLKGKHSSFPNSPCSSDVEGRPTVPADIIQDRLRYLADSWAGVELPTCRQVQFCACSDSLIWIIDNHDYIFYASTDNQIYNWKKVDGKAMLLASNQCGTVVWCISRQKIAYYRTGVRDSNPAGSGWEQFEKDMHYIAVDRDRLWAIKTNGDVFVRMGVSMQQPSGTSSIMVKLSSDLVQITCLNGLVWALDIYNHVQIFSGDVNSIESSTDEVTHWRELPGITASHVSLGSKSVCWLIDREYGVWFNQDIATDDDPLGGTWYQLSLGDGQTAWFSSILNYYTAGNEPKAIVANEKAGVLILGKQGSLNVAHGHLLGTRWDTTVPSQLSVSSWWSCVSAAGSDMNRGFVWALQPSGELFCFKTGGQSYKVHPPNRVVLKYCSAGPRSLWALTAGQDVYIRLGISDTCPQGLKWFKVDMVNQENGRLKSISCGNQVVWAVDYYGNAWFQMGRDDRRGGLTPTWISVEGCPLDGSKFTKIAVGPDDRIVWACDDKNNVYARKNITDNFWVGTNWEVVSGTSGKDVTISSHHVWALCPNGDVLCRFGVSSSNVLGDYWKKVPGSFEQISVSPNDEIWGIDRQGHLYQRQTLLFYGSTLSNRAPSYNDLFSDHNDWEFI